MPTRPREIRGAASPAGGTPNSQRSSSSKAGETGATAAPYRAELHPETEHTRLSANIERQGSESQPFSGWSRGKSLRSSRCRVASTEEAPPQSRDDTIPAENVSDGRVVRPARVQAGAGPPVVDRPRLVHGLLGGIARRLVIVTAEAGYGKTCLLVSGLARLGRPVAWLPARHSGVARARRPHRDRAGSGAAGLPERPDRGLSRCAGLGRVRRGQPPGRAQHPAGSVQPGKDVGEVRKAKDDGRLPMEDHTRGSSLFGRDATQARALAEAIVRGLPQRRVRFRNVRRTPVGSEVGMNRRASSEGSAPLAAGSDRDRRCCR